MIDPEMYLSAVSSVVVDITGLLERLEGRYCWSENERILDVGSGPGNITKLALLPFLPKDANVTGLDIAEEMVDYANKNNANERVSYKKQDVSISLSSNLQWKSESFDKIFSFYCLHLVPNLDIVAQNMYYLLKPGGYLTTHFCITSPFNTVKEVLSKQKKWTPYLKNDDDMSISSMQNAEDPCAYYSSFLKDAGFQEISCQAEKFTHDFSDMDEVLRLCRSVTPFLRRVPKGLLDEYLQDVRAVMQRINEVVISSDGKVSVTWLNMITVARK